ncbi:MAG: hypothetical protein DRJ52_08660 [Thermoprotei archaeon]|nr:MAG: hypothetical protein DRJ52_08660 [Thermoprotei archaeon]
MRLDLLALALVFITAISAILVTYSKAVLISYNYDTYAWVLAEKAANLLKEGRGVDTSAYVVVTLILPNGTVSRQYTIGSKPQIILGKAYTYRILGNNTLMRVEILIASQHDYIKEKP